MQVGDLQSSSLQSITLQPDLLQADLRLIPGRLVTGRSLKIPYRLNGPTRWDLASLYRPFRILTAFSTIMQEAAAEMNASIILADVGPNLGAINRAALIATDYVVVPLGADLFSLRGLHNLGPTLKRWRQDWKRRRDNWSTPDFPLPKGDMKPIGYVMQQHGVRLNRPVIAYDKWVNRIPEEYARNLLDDNDGPYPETPAQDKEHALATVKHYRSPGAHGTGSTQTYFPPHTGRWSYWCPRQPPPMPPATISRLWLRK